MSPGAVRVWGEDGDDGIQITLSSHPRSLVDGGAGEHDRLALTLPPGIDPDGPVAVDLATPAVALPGQPSRTVQWSGIEDHALHINPPLALRVTGTPDRDHISVHGSTVTAELFGGDDVLDANTSSIDWLRVDMGEGNDFLHSYEAPVTGDLGVGDDLAELGSGNDVVHGGEGNDEIDGRGGADFLYGGMGADTLYGVAGPDHLYGGLGSDLLSGLFGRDFLDGGDGIDDGDGGIGTDQCVALETSVNCEG